MSYIEKKKKSKQYISGKDL
uniref:Uncharacterized protein n=1 Tax=Rhizophora mucronata TaxID=61149 RepID=A0A2P2QZX5_RHIMU